MEHLTGWATSLGLTVSDGDGQAVVSIIGRDVRFAIAERHALMVVEVTPVGDDRLVLGAFDTVDDATRLLAMQLGTMTRHRRRMARLQPDSLRPGFVIEQAPTALWLSWFTGSAEFPVGERGRNRAIGFSVVERATVELIQSSYEHPDGHPLFAAA